MRTNWLLAACSFGLIPLAAGQPPPSAGTDLPEISWEAAREHIGKRCAVTGKVVMTRNIGSRCFLNFHENFREHFTVVINRESFDRFPKPPEELYADKQVRVVGEIIDFQGKPEIIVTAPEQVTILGDMATTAPATQPALHDSLPPATQPAAPVAPPFDGIVTIATYNVLNLFDEYDDPYTPDEGTRPKPSDERQRLAATFRTMNADVVALQEVENRGVLEEFNSTMIADLHYREVVLFEGNDDRGIDVAVLSRFPVGPVTSYRHVTYADSTGRTRRFRRDLLRVRIEPPGVRAFDLFVVHFKSRGGGEESAVIRQAEAAQARAILDDVLGQDPSAHFVFCGDLNDTFDTPAVRTLVGAGPSALRTFYEAIPESQRTSYNKPPYESMIDFILASPAMSPRFRDGSYRILHGSVESSGSDHNPVIASFDLR